MGRSRGASRLLCLLEQLEPRQLLATYTWEPKNDGSSIPAWSPTNTGVWLPVTVVYPISNQWTAPQHVSESAYESPPPGSQAGLEPSDPAYGVPGPLVVDQPGNWSLADYPDATDADVVIGSGSSVILSGYVHFPYAGSPVLSGDIQIDTLDNAGVLVIDSTGSLDVYGAAFKNDGTIEVESQIVFRNAGATSLAGSGTIILAGGSMRRPDQGQGTIGITGTQTIRGSGQILVPITATAGRISADAGGTLSLALASGSLANTGTLEATAGGAISNSVLAIADGTIVNTGGLIQAVGDTSRVELTGITLVGGSLATTGTGVIQVSGGTLNSATSAITSTAAIDIIGGTTWKGSVGNAGSITVRSTLLAPSSLKLDAGASLGGGGAIKLAGGSLNIVGSGVLTDTDNAISGKGAISGDAGSSLSLGSSLTADGGTLTVGVPLTLLSATLSAVNGGELTLTKSPTGTGSITAAGAGSGVRLQDGLTVAAGTSLGTTDTALVHVGSGGATLDGSAETFVSSADIVVGPESMLGLKGAIQNGGTISVVTNTVSLAGDTTLTGGGAVQLAYSSGDEGRISGTGTLTNTDNTIRGLGRIGQGMTAIVNSGSIRVERTVQSNTLTFLAPLTNTITGAMETNTFGRFAFEAGFVNQGTFSAYSASATGPVTNEAGASYEIGAGIADIKGTFTNDGLLTVPGQNSGSTPMFSTLAHGATGVQVTTSGRIVVANDFLNTSTQFATWNTSAATLVLASSQASASHRLQLAGLDLGTAATGWTSNFAWGGLEIKSGHSVSLESGRGEAIAAAGYFGAVTGAVIDAGTQSITNITGNGLNLYYDPAVSSNTYLGGKSYALQGGGYLIPKGAVGFPTALAVSGGSGQASLAWAAPDLPGNAEVKDYVVQYSSNGGSSWTTFNRPGGASTLASATVTGLTNGTSYRFRVAAKYASVTSESFASAPIVVGAPNAPTDVAAYPGNGRMTVAWTAPAQNGAAISGYVIEYKAADESGSTSSNSTATNATVFALTNGKQYTFRVAIKNSFGTGPFSAYTAATAPTTQPYAPSPPRNVAGTAGDGQVSLGWSSPLVDGNATIDDYVVQYGTNGIDWTTFDDGVSPNGSATVTSLANGTAYVFRVAAKNVAGTGAYSAVSAAVTPAGLPSVPLSLVATARNGEVDLSWSAPASNGGAAITDYVVKYTGPNGPVIVDDGVSSSTSTTVSGLTNGSTYFFSIAAVNAAGIGPSGSTVMATPRTVPAAPTAVVGAPSGGRVNLSWSTPAFDGGTPITDYRIEYSSDGGSKWTPFVHQPSALAFATVNGLTDGTSYVFRVAAINAAGTGGYSPNSTAVVPKAVPGVPLDVVGAPGNGQVSLDWAEPEDQGAEPILDYRIEFSTNNGSTWTTFKDTVSPSSSGLVTGLKNGTAYVFRVAAINAKGTSGYSPVSLPVTPRTLPNAPTALTATVGNKQVALSWKAPAVNGGAPVVDYLVQVSNDNGASWLDVEDGASSIAEAVVSGLSNGTAYVFRVAAVNAAGTGAFTAKSAALTPRAVPGVPTIVSATPGNVSVALAWSAPGEEGAAAISDYAIQYSSNGGSSWTTFSDGVSVTPSATVTGLKNGTNYVFRVAAVNSSGTGLYSAASPVAVPRSVPNAPTAVKATAGDGEVSLAWSAPAVNGGAAVVDYTVQVSSNGGSSWTTVTDAVSSTTTAVVGNLSNGTAYVFRVAAVNVAGAGAFSANSSAATPRLLPAAPTVPVGTVGNGQVSLTWTAPAVPSGQTITDYAVQVSSDDGITWKDYADGKSPAAAATVKPLTNGTPYRFRVAAITAAGTGRYSLPSLPITPRTTPGAPTALAGSLVDGLVTLTWAAPAVTGGAAITGYVVQYSSDKGKTWTSAPGGIVPTTAAAVGGLANGTSYVFRVAAVNAAGTGTFSSASAAVTPRVPIDSSVYQGTYTGTFTGTKAFGTINATISGTAITVNILVTVRNTQIVNSPASGTGSINADGSFSFATVGSIFGATYVGQIVAGANGQVTASGTWKYGTSASGTWQVSRVSTDVP